MNDNLRPFHLAFPVRDIEETILWYTKNLLCTVGRRDIKWVDFNFFGHQISAHLSSGHNKSTTNSIDGHKVPINHFGIILEKNQWINLSKNLKKNNIDFIIKPHTRFKSMKGEQSTMFIRDPSGNAIEFKSFANDQMIFEN